MDATLFVALSSGKPFRCPGDINFGPTFAYSDGDIIRETNLVFSALTLRLRAALTRATPKLAHGTIRFPLAFIEQ